MAACSHAEVFHVCMLPAMLDPKEQVEHYLLSARTIV